MKTLKSFDALSDFGDNLPDGPKYTGSLSLYARCTEASRPGRGISSAYNAEISLPRARGTGGKYGCARGRSVYRVHITRN